MCARGWAERVGVGAGRVRSMRSGGARRAAATRRSGDALRSPPRLFVLPLYAPASPTLLPSHLDLLDGLHGDDLALALAADEAQGAAAIKSPELLRRNSRAVRESQARYNEQGACCDAPHYVLLMAIVATGARLRAKLGR